MTKSVVWNYCVDCGHDTNHSVEGNHRVTHDADAYHCAIEHSVVKCMGCNSVSFRKVFYDYENAYPEENNEWIVPEEVETYPRANKGNLEVWHLPDVVASIYQETCDAYRDGALTLAGIGFRATIEAICNDQNITGKELSVRINNLASKGLISKKDSARLHSIRFMGNDAAHDIKKPSLKSLQAALVIVEHLITTVYILDKEYAGNLDSIIEDYPRFEALLDAKLKDFKSGDEYPLVKYLGKDIRLISGSTKSIEAALNARIGKGEYPKLKFGKEDTYLGSKEKLRHYIVV
ncbi:DUF4145 domain-containing protein [Ectopseudomonas mendocina]|uniref:DUF4145 domain-containing protein n=1 Tax=Ectopseudomonas mendocina TaxID=300 RepID=UPI0005A05DAF|nr:DUF4145 domain-containing protein [Pseudomonas mendocina]